MSRGGYRVGGGRPPGIKETKPRRKRKKKEPLVSPEADKGSAPPKSEAKQDMDPAEFLRKVWNDPNMEPAIRIRAAEVVFRVTGEKKGKKEEKMERARIAGSSGKFFASRPPIKLVK